MITSIDFVKYKKLNNVKVIFKPGINIIAGTNGTCKSSLLHIISNSYKKTSSKSSILSNNKCISHINKANKHISPKIETLNRLSQSDVNAAGDVKGTIYTVNYADETAIDFRTHTSKTTNNQHSTRYAVKPKYPTGQSQSLPESLTLYLSMDRLYPFGEYQDIDKINREKMALPTEYRTMISNEFKKFTNYNINDISKESVGSIKYRSQFTTDDSAIDSNTISAGEDNLMILLTALYSLVYYSESLNEPYKDSPTYLLIDEFDASLHPAFQIKLLDLFNDVHQKYRNIHFIMTTHSLLTLNRSLKDRYNVIYLVKEASGVIPLIGADMRKIEADLSTELFSNIFGEVKIPIICEDDEAREFLQKIIDYIPRVDSNFSNLSSYFELVDIKIGCEQIKSLFRLIPSKYLSAIGILDGDQDSDNLRSNRMLTLPGNHSPEVVVFNACEELIKPDDYSKTFLRYIQDKTGLNYEMISNDIISDYRSIIDSDELKKGERRELLKKLYAQYQSALNYVFNYWIEDPRNRSKIESFIKDLQIAFYQVAEYHGLHNSIWSTFSGQND